MNLFLKLTGYFGAARQNILGFHFLRYNGAWWDGTDIALIAINEITPTWNCNNFAIWATTAGFNLFNIGKSVPEKRPRSCAIVGFPLVKKNGKSFSHQPFVSLAQGENISEFRNRGTTIRYFCKTWPGMSGGAVLLDGKIVGKLLSF